MGEEVAVGPAAGERRMLFGLERRGMAATAIIGLIVAFFAVGLPLIAGSLEGVPPNGSVIADGTVLAIPGGRAQFRPTPGWFRNRDQVPDDVVSVVSSGVEFRIWSDAAGADSDVLISGLKRAVREEIPSARFLPNVTTPATGDLVGVASWFDSPDREGIVAAFSQDGSGVLVFCVGLPGAVRRLTDNIDSMLASIELIR